MKTATLINHALVHAWRLAPWILVCLAGWFAAIGVVRASEPWADPLTTLPTAADSPQSFRVLSYHDVRDNLRATFDEWPDNTAIDTRDLVAHFNWMAQSGYQPVSMQAILDARSGGTPLPHKAILLTFDDGYKSAYTKVFPLLKQFNYPAVFAIVGEWMDTPASRAVQYGDRQVSRDQFLSWDEVREMANSGLAEFASHSYAMHRGVIANPQGNSIPAAVSRIYDAPTQLYEHDAAYLNRIEHDLNRSAQAILRETGRGPRIMVWPYGAYSRITNRLAAEAGMPITMSLEAGPNTLQTDLSSVRRMLVSSTTSVADLVRLLKQPADYDGMENPLQRVIHVDLDYVYDPDPAVREANLSTLLDRIYRIKPTTVYLQAYADPDGDGAADALYFPSRHMPLRADLFSRVAWQLRTRAGVQVYAWMPVMAFRLPPTHVAASRIVQIMPGGPESASIGRYHRLSIFDPLVRQTIHEIYEDLGKHANFHGILFHDDATFSDFEDASPGALAFYNTHWNLPPAVATIRSDASLRAKWRAHKTDYLNRFTLDLTETLRDFRPSIYTARNLYAQPVMNPDSEEWFAQSLPSFIRSYDYTAIMAMPYMEGAQDADAWLDELVGRVKMQPGALRKSVFEIQSRDWVTGKPVPSETMAAQLQRLHRQGVRSFGYYPDDFHRNHPAEDVIKPVISVQSHPVPR